jgi:2-keto-3-deoxy-L-rhamnonate aldolase RhmA
LNNRALLLNMKSEPAHRKPHWTNPVKDLLKKGQPVVGAVISTNSVEIAAQAAALGFDFLWLEMEHSPLTLETVRNIVLATRGLPAVPIARPPVNELWMAKRLLDAGVLGVIFPFTSTPALARQAAAACRYPPAGLRGSGADLAQFRWPAPGGYYDFADRNVLVVAVVENTIALSHIDEIAATPGIDVLFIGTSDLSFSLGLRGRQDHSRLEMAVARIVAAGKRNGKILGRPGGTPEEIKRFQRQGFLFFMAGTDTDLMAAGARELLEPLGKKRSFRWGGGL